MKKDQHVYNNCYELRSRAIKNKIGYEKTGMKLDSQEEQGPISTEKKSLRNKKILSKTIYCLKENLPSHTGLNKASK